MRVREARPPHLLQLEWVTAGGLRLVCSDQQEDAWRVKGWGSIPARGVSMGWPFGTRMLLGGLRRGRGCSGQGVGWYRGG